MSKKALLSVALVIPATCMALVRFGPPLAGKHDPQAGALERAAIAHLHEIADAQFRVQDSALIDTDHDELGEYAFYDELTGLAPLRTSGAPLDPPQLNFAKAATDPQGIVTRNGYHFRLFLPGPLHDGRHPGLTRTQGAAPDPEQAEKAWCAYAWPTQTSPAQRAFFINQEKGILELPDGYRGTHQAPAFVSALDPRTPDRLTRAQPSPGQSAFTGDGQPWTPLGRR